MCTSPHQFTPLLPREAQLEPLLATAHDLARESLSLAHPASDELRSLLRGMNSYYSNRIEGQHTRPLELEQALRKDFSADAALAARQRLALAHMAAEAAIEQRYATPAQAQALYTCEGVQRLHAELFSRLPEADRRTDEGEPITPGALRQRDVQVGRHIAPAHGTVPALLDTWGSAYAGLRRGEMSLVGAAAAHQRLGWVHPFIDGNGRVMRLHTHALLHAQGYTRGLWSVLRGFARSSDRYYQLMADADAPRRGDLDGRGNLSEQALLDWTAYVLDTALDQLRFMRSLLQMGDMKARIAALLGFEEDVLRSGVRRAALLPLHYLQLQGGELERGEFKAMLALGERTAATVLAALLKRGLLRSDSPQGRVRFAYPLHALRFYFPALWPEAEADAAAAAAAGP
jgi:Fic family protein